VLKDQDYDRGLELRRQMFGSAGAEQQTENTTELNDKLQEIVTRWCFGDLWQRPELPLRDRSLITVAMLVALGRSHELNIHMRGALANGISPTELRELCLHSMLYCGIPPSVEGIRTLEAILQEKQPDSELLQRADGGA
jgi:4-carboxymuconolactone decarboxylase